ncbi:MAG: hypothetical protein JXB48_17915 [Candidatus Latescibacteria bacterium]|nr:hypothetical protein [Candidatus Latescibacterota bacterium]
MSPSLRGLMLSSFIEAFMSTISTDLNVESSNFFNDFNKRFVRKDATECHYVLVSRIAIFDSSSLPHWGL